MKFIGSNLVLAMALIAVSNSLPNPDENCDELTNLAVDAGVFAVTFFYMTHPVYRAIMGNGNAGNGAPGWNKLEHNLKPSGPEVIAGSPNADVTYSSIWYDLHEGPIVTTIPAFNGRFYTFQWTDAEGNTIAALSPRNDKNNTITRAIITMDPSFESNSSDTIVVKSYSRLAWGVFRFLPNGTSEDLLLVNNLQRSVSAQPLIGTITSASTSHPEFTSDLFENGKFAPASKLFEVLGWQMKVNGIQLAEQEPFNKFAPLGLTKDGYNPGTCQRKLLTSLIPKIFSDVKAADTNGVGQARNNGWVYDANSSLPYPENSFLQKAVVAFMGTVANRIEEVIYFRRSFDSTNTMLDGSKYSYTVRFETQPPVNGYWSLTAYNHTTKLIQENPYKIYSVGSHKGTLMYDVNGGVQLYLSVNSPSDPKMLNNWFPIPNGEFDLMIRTYWPTPELISQEYLMPNVVKTN
ncbi:hypothetical protein HDV02_001379 [Globomyces sp. JEL0801]|nr:hypothetical protein HDV02_001379 [Globomyces sp. JEL0801]